jgi:hypothetical protein
MIQPNQLNKVILVSIKLNKTEYIKKHAIYFN